MGGLIVNYFVNQLLDDGFFASRLIFNVKISKKIEKFKKSKWLHINHALSPNKLLWHQRNRIKKKAMNFIL